jgi:hypothetical protein
MAWVRIDPSTAVAGDYVQVMSPVTNSGEFTVFDGKVSEATSNPAYPNLFSFRLEGARMRDYTLGSLLSDHQQQDNERLWFNTLETPFVLVFRQEL